MTRFLLVSATVAVFGCGGDKRSGAGANDEQPLTEPANRSEAKAARDAGVSCAATASLAAKAWNAALRDKLQRAFAASGLSYAGGVATRTVALLDRYAASLTAMAKEACAATALRQQQPAAVDALRQRCLRRRTTMLTALVTHLSGPSQAVIGKAIMVAHRLPAVADCAESKRLMAVPPPAADKLAKLVQLHAHLDELWVRLQLGRPQAVKLELKAVVLAAQRIGHPPALAEAMQLEAQAYRRMGKAKHAEQNLRAAVKLAAMGKDDRRLASVWLDLMATLVDGGRLDDAARSAKLIDAALVRAGYGLARQGADRALRQSLHDTTALLLLQQGKAREAAAEAARSIALGAGDPLSTVGASFLRGAALHQAHQLPGAVAAYRSLLAVAERELGPHHPMIGRVAIALGRVASEAGEHATAVATLRRATTLFAASYGGDHLHVATAQLALASALAAKGDNKQAVTVARRARATLDKAGSKRGVAQADALLTKLGAHSGTE